MGPQSSKNSTLVVKEKAIQIRLADTVSENEYHDIPSKELTMEMGFFEKAKPILKILPIL